MNTSNEGKLPPKPSIIPGARISTPPPIPEKAKRASIIPPVEREANGPEIYPRKNDAQELVETLKCLYQDEPRILQNGNSNPATFLHVNDARDAILLKLERQTRLFRIPTKYLAAAAVALALGTTAFAAHSCNENKLLEQKIEQQQKKLDALEKQLKTPKQAKSKTSYLVPKSLRNPSSKPSQKMLSQRKLLRKRT